MAFDSIVDIASTGPVVNEEMFLCGLLCCDVHVLFLWTSRSSLCMSMEKHPSNRHIIHFKAIGIRCAQEYCISAQCSGPVSLLGEVGLF